MASKVYAFAFAVHLCASSALYIDGKATEVALGNEEKIAKEKDVPKICQKDAFLKRYKEKGDLLFSEDIFNLKNCSQYYPNCKDQAGTLTATYAEGNDGKTVIIFQATDIKKQGLRFHEIVLLPSRVYLQLHCHTIARR